MVMTLRAGLRLERASKADWDEALGAFPGATAFHGYDFLECMASLLRCTFEPLVIMRGMEPAGAAPLMVRRVGPLCTVNWMPFPYLGPLAPDWLLPDVLSLLATEGKKRGAMHHQQSFAGLLPDGAAASFQAGTDRTLVVALAGRSDEALLGAMTRDGRREIGKARREGVEVVPAVAGDSRLMEQWAQAIYVRQGQRPPYPAGTYERIFRVLGRDAGSHFCAARLEGRTIAVDMAFSLGGRSLGWQVAVDPAHRWACPQALLLWHQLTAARDRGDFEFDLLGSPTDAVAAYKRKFGSVDRHYTTLSTHSFLGRARYKVAAIRA
jgi:CelD/BcsL family acetyltransferase involved in cellulose biosynthesis